jgi:hypothetical protein
MDESYQRWWVIVNARLKADPDISDDDLCAGVLDFGIRYVPREEILAHRRTFEASLREEREEKEEAR